MPVWLEPSTDARSFLPALFSIKFKEGVAIWMYMLVFTVFCPIFLYLMRWPFVEVILIAGPFSQSTIYCWEWLTESWSCFPNVYLVYSTRELEFSTINSYFYFWHWSEWEFTVENYSSCQCIDSCDMGRHVPLFGVSYQIIDHFTGYCFTNVQRTVWNSTCCTNVWQTPSIKQIFVIVLIVKQAPGVPNYSVIENSIVWIL